MFTKKSHTDIKKSTSKIQDSKKDSATRLRHLKTILEHVDIEEAKSLFEINFSHVYYILYDTFDQAETNLRQRVHKAHREELDGSLWLLGKILCLLPELIAKRWQCNSISRIMSKLIHHGNSGKLRREGVRYFLLWYQALGENAPIEVHAMYSELVPGLSIPQRGLIGSTSETDFNMQDYSNHPNMRGELGGSVFHDTGAHPVKPTEIIPLLPPSSHEKSAAPDPRDGIEILLENMIQATGCLKWRDNTPQKHMKGFAFLLQRFRDVYLPIFCPDFDNTTSIYDPKLSLPVMRTISKQKEMLSSCVFVLVHWISKFTLDQPNQKDNFQIEEEAGENASLLSNLKMMGYSQKQLIRDVLYSTRDNINFVHEVFRQAFLMNFTSKAQIEAMKIVIAVYRHWMSLNNSPPFLLEPEENSDLIPQRPQRLRTDSYIGAILKENLIIRAGLQNVLQVFITHAANVFMVHTGHLNIVFMSKTRDVQTTPLDEQIEICKRVLNIYRTMVMNARKDCKTWEQLLLVLLQITSIVLTNPHSNESSPAGKTKLNTLGSRLAPAIFQTLIVTWIRAHTNVAINASLWEKFLSVLSSLTDRDELITEWNKTMQILTRVLGREVYKINLSDLPLDRLAESKNKRRRGIAPFNGSSKSQALQDDLGEHLHQNKSSNESSEEQQNDDSRGSSHGRSIPTMTNLNRSYSEGSLAPYRKSRERRRLKSTRISASPSNVEASFNRLLSATANISVSSETLNSAKPLPSLHGDSGTLRRARSLDSLRPGLHNDADDQETSQRGSRSPSPTASSGIEGGSIKDSPMQIEVMTGDTSSIDTQEETGSIDGRHRSIMAGGTAKGWQPDAASVMWKRMLGALGDVNKITNPKLHAKVFKYLYDTTENLIKIKLNQGISNDNHTTPPPPTLVPPIGICAPWCYGAFALSSQFRDGKLWALQLLCTIARHGGIGSNQLPLFYHAIHQALTGEDRGMSFTALKYLGGSRFLSLLFPGHTLLLLDLVHASSVILTSTDTNINMPRAEVAGLLGSLLCFPKTSLPNPVLQPSDKHIELVPCPDLQDLILSVVLRCARREPSSKARCMAIAALGQWIMQSLTHPEDLAKQPGFTQTIPHSHGNPIETTTLNPRLTEAIQVILQALQFRHRTIARVASETLKLCAEKGLNISKIEKLPQLIINSICIALEIQNVTNPKEADKHVITSLLLCLGEFCMSMPIRDLVKPVASDTNLNLIAIVLKILHQISTGTASDHIKLFTADEDFDMNITLDDVKEQSGNEANYQTTETIQNCKMAIKLCAKMITMHLVTNLAHFPMGIGASRLSSLVDEQDDLTIGMLVQSNQMRENMELGAPQVLNAPNLQMFMLSEGLVASFVELPSLKLPGGGIAAGLVTANRQVRVLLRDLSGKVCWDASILYKEPRLIKAIPEPIVSKQQESSLESHSSGISSGGRNYSERQQFFSDKVSYLPSRHFIHPRNNFASLDPMISNVGIPVQPLRHTLRHRPPNQLPLAKDMAPDLDQLDDLLQYIGHTSPECLNNANSTLNTPCSSPLGSQIESNTIQVLLSQRSLEHEYNMRQNLSINVSNSLSSHATSGNYGYGNVSLDSSKSISLSSDNSSTNLSKQTRNAKELLPFQYCRLIFSQLGLAGWERRKRTHLLNRTDKLLREMRNLDTQRCRETHKMAVIYVAAGQEDKNSILRNSCGSSTYEMFVSALGWEVELESHNGFLGGLPRVGCGSTAPYYATPFLEVIYHVATRMPTDTSEAILNKTRHLGNDEVHIVWSEHIRDYRRDILPTEFCDILITVYPLKSGLFRVTVNRKPDVPWFGPIWDEAVVSGTCLASLVRATAINASRTKRTSLPFYQQFYEERNRSLITLSSRHKESSSFEDFTARVFNPIPNSSFANASIGSTANSSNANAPLAAALIDHHRSSTKSKSWHQHPDMVATTTTSTSSSVRELSHQGMALQTISLDHPSPRPLRKLHHPFKTGQKKSASGGLLTPPESPTMPGRKFK